jgi:hypothetical protein
MREACGFTALQLEVAAGIARAINRLFASAGRDNDLAELRVGGTASDRGQSTHGSPELVDLCLLVVAFGRQLARLGKQRLDLGVKQSQRAFGREPLSDPDHADGERDHD